MKAILCRSAIAGFSLLLTAGAEVKAADAPIQVDWIHLHSHVLGHNMSTVLTDGTKLTGKALAVKPDTLAIRIGQTSNPTRFHDTADIPRTQLTGLRVSRSGWKWRVIIPIVGFAGGALIGGRIGNSVDPRGFIISDGAATGMAFGSFSGAALGYVVGHFADRHTTVIEIVGGSSGTGLGSKAQ